MREIEGIDDVLATLEGHWPAIVAHFDQQNEQFKALMAQDHDPIGRVLKCHLVVENCVEAFLIEHYGLRTLRHARLTFFQKASLLPVAGSAAAFVRPGVLRLNAIRNTFGHRLNTDLSQVTLEGINEVLGVARSGVDFPDALSRIEAFSAVACAFLMPAPPQLQTVFIEAFHAVRSRPLVPADQS